MQMATSRLPKLAYIFLLVAFLTGLASALQTPVLSLFLANKLQAAPFAIGLFFTLSAVIGILVSQILATISDRYPTRRLLILTCCLLGAIGCLFFAYNRNYYLLLVVGVTLTSFGGTANPQLFALAREYVEKIQLKAVMFNAILRAQVSLAWIIGPPLAFSLALGVSFTFMFIMAGVAFILCGALSWFFLHDVHTVKQTCTKTQGLQAPSQHRKSTLFLFIVCTLVWAANCMYLVNMPLYVTQELHLPDKLAGIMMGTAAGLEIPAMLFAGYLIKYTTKHLLICIAIVAGLIFYSSMLFCTNIYLLIGLQLFNAIFIGVIASLGMVYFQELMPNQAGIATTLFSNTNRVGWIIAGALSGTSAQLWGYHSIFYLALILILISIFCMIKVKRI